jgi:ureidoglycolate lyase
VARPGLLRRTLRARPTDAVAFAPYGGLVDAASTGPELINDGSTARHSDLSMLDLRGPDRDPVLGIYVAQARRFPLAITRLERHREAAQVFLPLGGHRFVVVVATGRDEPDWDRLEAFVTAPGQGVCLHRDCWHHGLVALGDGDRFAVIEGGNYRHDTTEVRCPDSIELLAP